MNNSTTQESFGLDACTLSFATKGNPVVTQNLDNAKQNGNTIEIPPVAYYEVKRGFMASRPVAEAPFTFANPMHLS